MQALPFVYACGSDFVLACAIEWRVGVAAIAVDDPQVAAVMNINI